MKFRRGYCIECGKLAINENSYLCKKHFDEQLKKKVEAS